jgi:hypothetical protein
VRNLFDGAAELYSEAACRRASQSEAARNLRLIFS